MILSVVVQPSFERSYIVFIETIDQDVDPPQYRVVLRRERDRSWGSMMDEMHRQQGDTIHLGEADQRAAIARMRVATDELVTALDSTTVELLKRAWEGIVARTQYPREVLTAPDGTGVAFAKADGTEYHFWASGQNGATHSPETGTLLSEFVFLGETLGAFVSAPSSQRGSVQRRLTDQARALLARVARNESCVKPYKPHS